jgi:TctA family transporter
MLTILVFLCAIIAGVIVGLIPGVGMLGLMIISYPWLIGLPVQDLLIFYAVAGGTTQFVGSVIASIFGIAAESSSIPACVEGPRLFLRGQGPQSLSACSIGSLFGAISISVILLAVIPYVSNLVNVFYNNHVQLALFSAVMLILMISGRNRFRDNLWLVILGCLLSMIGTGAQFTVEPRLTLGIDALNDGLPFVSVALAIFALPQILALLDTKIDITKVHIQNFSLWQGLKSWSSMWTTSARGTAIGTVTGLVPGMTTILASNLGYTFERWLRRRHGVYRTDGDMQSLVSAETANNSAQLTSMLPLFLFGIPIVGSEAVLLNLMEHTGIQIGFNTLMLNDMFTTVTLSYILAAVIAAVIAWQGAKYLVLIYRIPTWMLALTLALISVISVAIAGWSAYNLWLYLAVFFVLLPIGIMLRRYDTSLVVFAFLVYPFFEGAAMRFAIIYF